MKTPEEINPEEKIAEIAPVELAKNGENFLNCDKKTVEDRDRVEHTIYNFSVAEKHFSVLFKNPELLLDPNLLQGKTVLAVENLPYTRDTNTVKQNIKEQEKITDHFYRLEPTSSPQKKFNLRTSLSGTSLEDGDILEKNFWTNIPHDLPSHNYLQSAQSEILKESLIEGENILISGGSVEEILHLAETVKNNIPELAEKTNLLEKFSLSEIEDFLVSFSFDSEGKLSTKENDGRKLLFQAALGDENSLAVLKSKMVEKKEQFPDFIKYQLIIDRNHLRQVLKQEKSEELVKIVSRKLEAVEKTLEVIASNGKLEFPKEVIEELDKYVLIHMTEFYPVYDQESERWLIPTRSQATGNKLGRLSVHFSVDAIATAANIAKGNWNNMPYAIVVPWGQMIKENGVMPCFLPADTWWIVDPNDKGLKLPPNSTILANVEGEKIELKDDKEVSAVMSHRGPKTGIDKLTVSGPLNEVLNTLLREKYNVSMQEVAKEGWVNRSEYVRNQLENLIKETYPSLRATLHSNLDSHSLETMINDYLMDLVLVDHREEIKEMAEKLDNVGSNKETKKRLKKILDHQGESFVQYRREQLIGYINDTFTKSYLGNNNEEEYLRLKKQTPVIIPKEIARQLLKTGVI